MADAPVQAYRAQEEQPNHLSDLKNNKQDFDDDDDDWGDDVPELEENDITQQPNQTELIKYDELQPEEDQTFEE